MKNLVLCSKAILYLILQSDINLFIIIICYYYNSVLFFQLRLGPSIWADASRRLSASVPGLEIHADQCSGSGLDPYLGPFRFRIRKYR